METRLGDIIDDYCVKCKRITNHAVVSMIGSDPAKVRCRTCYTDHDYRHELAPPPKVDSRKAALFNEVLEQINVPPSPASEGVAPASESDAPVSEGDAPPATGTATRAKSKRARK